MVKVRLFVSSIESSVLFLLLLVSIFTSSSPNRHVVEQPPGKAGKLVFRNDSLGRLEPVHLIIATMQIMPFMMRKLKDTNSGSSEAEEEIEWYGYCMDFLEELTKHLPYNITYEIYEVTGKQFGVKEANSNETDAKRGKIWNGIVGELQQGNAHLALCPLSVMAERELVIDFTVPFYDLVGSQILMKRAQVAEDYFKFLTVLDGQVWLSIGLAYVATSVVIFLFDRLSPYSRKNWARIKRLRRQTNAVSSANRGQLDQRPLVSKSQQPVNSQPLAESWRSSLRNARRRSSLLIASIRGQETALEARPQRAANAVQPVGTVVRARPNTGNLSELLRPELELRKSLASLSGAWAGRRRRLHAAASTSTPNNRSSSGAAAETGGGSSDSSNSSDSDSPRTGNDKSKPDFGLRDSLWFCITSLTPQGGGEAPANLSGRLVAGAWWLFCFIIIASYTANLAAFLTVSRLDIPIESMDDLIKQYRVKYAPQEDTAEHAYFERMAYIEEIFYNIWKDMSLNESLSEEERAKFAVWDYPISDKYTKVWAQIRQVGMPKTFGEAMNRVRSSTIEEGFALLTDAMVVKHAVMTDCSLKPVGDEFSRKPIALGIQKNLGRLRDDISHAILHLINQRFMETLREKWWTNNPDRVICENQDESEGISIKNIGGVFIIIVAGVFLSFLVWSIERFAYKTKIEISQALVEGAHQRA